MNIPRKYQLMIVVGIALSMMFYGFAGLIFKFEVDKNIENNVSLVLMAIAAFIIIAGKKKFGKEKKTENSTINESTSEDQNSTKKVENDENTHGDKNDTSSPLS